MNTTDRSTEDRRRGPERRQLRSDDVSGSIMSELEGTLLKDADPFPYLMLVSFEASGLVRFVALLLLWPILRLLRALGAPPELGLRIMVFVAVAGVEAAEIEAVARAVLPKFLMDDVDMEAWTVFSSFQRRVVVTSWPRVMVEWFAKDHLQASDVVGRELEVNRSGRATGFFKGLDLKHAVHVQSASFFDVKDGSKPDVVLGRPESSAQPFLSLCKEQFHPPISSADIIKHSTEEPIVIRPRPVIFHDGRLVQRPTPLMALLIVLWIPLGVALVVVRIAVGLLVPIQWTPALAPFFGGKLIVRGRPPASSSSSSGGGVLFVCTHRSLMDPVVLSTVLGRRVPAVTYSISRLTEMLSPIRTIRLSRNRQVDADRIRSELCRGDLVVCPEGTTCREPFLLRFSALFAELTDQIVPVAMNYRVGLFHATTARGWKAMDPIFFFMNPRPIYEVTFLNQLPVEVTCAAGKSPYDVANYVQRILAAALGFECTNFTRKDKYRVLAGNDGTVIVSKPAAMASAWPWATRAKEVLRFLL